MGTSRYDQTSLQDFPDQDADSASWSYAAAAGGIVNSTAGVTIKAAPAAQPAGFGATRALRNYVKSIDVCSDALGAATELVIRDGAGGAVLWRAKLQTAAMPLESIVFDKPLRGSPGTPIEIATLTATVTGGVFVNARGYVGL